MARILPSASALILVSYQAKRRPLTSTRATPSQRAASTSPNTTILAIQKTNYLTTSITVSWRGQQPAATDARYGGSTLMLAMLGLAGLGMAARMERKSCKI